MVRVRVVTGAVTTVVGVFLREVRTRIDTEATINPATNACHGASASHIEADWWYDGKRYAEDVGNSTFQKYRTGESLRIEDIWGHRVANRAIDFLECAGDEPFLLVVSFDEPHGPYRAPEEYHDGFDMTGIPERPNFGAPVTNKPRLQQIHRKQFWKDGQTWKSHREKLRRHFADNAYIDSEIARVICVIDKFSTGDTTIIYTSDHGDMQGSHGLSSKGPMMYEEITNVPLIIKTPECIGGSVSHSPASHLDILPTMLDLASIRCPDSLQGVSIRPTFIDSNQRPREHALLSFTRFAINHDDWGEFFPIRCITDGRHKLVINLHDTDEFYDLVADPYETTNLLRNNECSDICGELHDALLDEMDRIRDPFRSYLWGDREWRSVRQPYYYGGKRRNPPLGFPFQPTGIEADGTSHGQQPASGDTDKPRA